MKEQLSALIDGEFDVENAQHLLIVAKSDGELKQSWDCYHLIGDVMRGEYIPASNMTSRIMALIEDEPTVISPQAAQHNIQQLKSRTFASSKLWSVAASVAAVLFVGLIVLQNQQAGVEGVEPVQIAESGVPSEYIAAHQAVSPNGTVYYIQNASYSGR